MNVRIIKVRVMECTPAQTGRRFTLSSEGVGAKVKQLSHQVGCSSLPLADEVSITQIEPDPRLHDYGSPAAKAETGKLSILSEMPI